jgi:predicted glycogen debranching enzyme
VLTLDRDVLRDLDAAALHEWVLADGVGGWAASTVIGLDARRGHGLLFAALPAQGVLLLLARVEESVLVGNTSQALATVEYPGTLHPAGHRQATSFSLDPLPSLTWEVAGGRVSRSVARVQGLPATVVEYAYEGALPASIELRPLLACREPQALQRESGRWPSERISSDELAVSTPNAVLHLAARGAAWQVDGYWYRDHVHRAEAAGGRDDLWSPGVARVPLATGRPVHLVAWAGALPAGFTPAVTMAAERRRLRALGEAPEGLLPELRKAADVYGVRTGSSATLAAARPGVDDPTPEAMIALPGLCLATGRHDLARAVLTEHAARITAAVLGGGSGSPRALLAALWFAQAAFRFVESTGDRTFFKARLSETLFLAIESCRAAGRRDVHAGPDGLLFIEGAEAGALVGTRPPVEGPVHAVEVQALWHNALLIAAEAAREAGLTPRANEWAGLAAKVRDAVLRDFWLDSRGHLADAIGAKGVVRDLGPAQLYALGLPHALLPREKAAPVLEGVRRHLVTARGLRGVHGETVWPHLAGIYFDAVIRIWGEVGKAEAWSWMDQFAPHLREGCVGQVSQALTAEDGEPEGAPAYAPAVAEVLRVLVRLGRRPGRVVPAR